MTLIKSIAPLLLLVLILGIALFALMRLYPASFDRREPVIIQGIPTDVVRVGTLRFTVPGNSQDIPFLEYEENGATSTIPLIIDELSVCSVSSGATPCMAMSVQWSMPFGDKRAVIEGNQQDGRIVVRKMRVLQEGEPALTYDPGHIYIPWPQAVSLIQECRVTSLMQSHALGVYLQLSDGREVVAIEPIIDEVFRIQRNSQSRCGPIPLATE
jgi:hypothetical protein